MPQAVIPVTSKLGFRSKFFASVGSFCVVNVTKNFMLLAIVRVSKIGTQTNLKTRCRIKKYSPFVPSARNARLI